MTARVVLVGLPGVGKTTVGGALAAALGVRFVDVDTVIEQRCGRSAASVLRDDGEVRFRELELEALEASLHAASDAVVATGGGVVEAPRARELLVAAPLVVQLTAPEAVLADRLADGDRPLVAGSPAERLAELAARRADWYATVADATVDASGPVDDVVVAIRALVVAP